MSNYKYKNAEEAVNGTIPAKYICTANGIQQLTEKSLLAFAPYCSLLVV